MRSHKLWDFPIFPSGNDANREIQYTFFQNASVLQRSESTFSNMRTQCKCVTVFKHCSDSDV